MAPKMQPALIRMMPCLAAWLAAAPLPAAAPREADARADEVLRLERPRGAAGARLRWDVERVRRLRAAPRRLTVRQVPLPGGGEVDLALQPFDVLGRAGRLVLGDLQLGDRPLPEQTQLPLLLRGQVLGRPRSVAFLALSARRGGRSGGFIELDGRRFVLHAPGDEAGTAPDGGGLQISEATEARGGDGVPLCHLRGQRATRRAAAGAGGIGGGGDPPLYRGPRVIELAVETDYEFFRLFDDVQAAAEYVVELYGAISAIYLRDVDARFELSYVRLWNSPDDLFDEDNPLSAFRLYWNQNMQAVNRDLAQLISGRRNYPFGGAAWLDAVCGASGYSVVGYILGTFPDPAVSDPYHYDINVVAHELGHNCGTPHTHDLGIDECDDLDTPPQRGTIMSYCSQTVSGGNGATDLRFHSRIQQEIEIFLQFTACTHHDCNFNGVDDAADIAGGASADANDNGVPDDCEDCNGNGVLDPTDIELGTSADGNANGVPDDCEPDCNDNDLPDDVDIVLGLSTDFQGNGIPDECETDCDGDGTSDYLQIQADLGLDLDRDAALDACQDCDGDGTPDLDALAGAHFVWATSRSVDRVKVFHSHAGTPVLESDDNHLDMAQDLLITPQRRILVSSALDGRVAEFAADGAYVGDFVAAHSGGLGFPTFMCSAPNGHLLVSDRVGHTVLEYDEDGVFVRVFVAAESGGLFQPFGLAFDTAGRLYVASAVTREVLRFDADGAFLDVFVSAGDGGLEQPRGMTFKADGNLLVVSQGSNQVLEYGADGDFVGQFNRGGTDEALTLDLPWGIRVGPNGNVFVTRTVSGPEGEAPAPHLDDVAGEPLRRPNLHVLSTRIYEFDAATGIFINSFVLGNDTGLVDAGGFDFMPGDDTDCNVNALPDVCEEAAALAVCDRDCNGNGIDDRREIVPFGPEMDCNFNGVPDACELAAFDCNFNGLHDACEIVHGDLGDCDLDGVPDVCQPLADCNTNGLHDPCEISAGAHPDCDNNWVPDECDTDCNANGLADACDIRDFLSPDANGNGVPDECDVSCRFVLASEPSSGAIDARQPSGPDGGPALGWDTVDLEFDGLPTAFAADFSVVVEGVKVKTPQVVQVESLAGNVLRLYLNQPVPPGAWTEITHDCSGGQVRLGYLPGDVDGDATSGVLDILALVDVLNGVGERPAHATDINRSGLTEPGDILRQVDLLNGAGAFEPWNGRALP